MAYEDLPAHVKAILESGKLPDMRNYSKAINFYLDYHDSEFSLEPLIEQITCEAEDYEDALADTKRKRKRSAEARKHFQRAVRILLLNALQAEQMMSGCLRFGIPLNKNEYGLKKRYAPPFITYRQFLAAYHKLLGLWYIETYSQGVFDRETKEGTLTRIQGAEPLFTRAKEITQGKPIPFYSDFSTRDESVILRGNDHRLKDYEDTTFTRKARKNLERINDVLSKHEYVLAVPENRQDELKRELHSNYCEEPELNSPFIDFTAIRLYRIFNNGSFTQGGRFYGGWWQNTPKEFRPLVTIDGKPTVEKDYSMLHPAILYAEEGCTLDFDAYKDIHPKVSRKIGKIAFNALLNARGTPEPPEKFDAEYSGIGWKDYLELMKEKHSAIAHLFLQGYGLGVQYRDSELAEDILLHFANKGIACLPIHDSFIVNVDYGDELEQVMKESFFKRFNATIDVQNVTHENGNN